MPQILLEVISPVETGMVIVAVAFAVIFLFRDVQILVVQDRKALVERFAVYTLLLVSGLTIFAGFAGSRPAWTERQFALWAILAQLVELGIVAVLSRYALGRYTWLGCLLPAPAFLMGLFEVQRRLVFPNALGIVAGVWLAIVAMLAAILWRLNNPWEDRKFARDFAMMSGCTALIFVPFWLS
jgi:hypothetical protein